MLKMLGLRGPAEKTSQWRVLFSVFALGLVCLVLPDAARADLLTPGVDVTVSNNYPAITTVYIGPVSGPTTSTLSVAGFAFSFTGDTFTFTNPYSGTYFSVPPTGFNGFVLTFAGLPEGITDVVNDPSSQLDPSSISFSSDSIAIEFNGLPQVPGQQSFFDVTFATTPEPSSLVLFGAGLMALTGMGLRRKRLT